MAQPNKAEPEPELEQAQSHVLTLKVYVSHEFANMWRHLSCVEATQGKVGLYTGTLQKRKDVPKPFSSSSQLINCFKRFYDKEGPMSDME